MPRENWLKPEPKRLDRRLPLYGVSDIEASDWIKFLIIGYYTKNRDKFGIVNEQYESFKRFDEYTEFIFSDDQPRDVVFFHFGGKYDFLFLFDNFCRNNNINIFDVIPRGSGFLSFKASTMRRVTFLNDKQKYFKYENGYYLVVDRTITFKDSSALLPFSLDSLSKNFEVEHKKMKLDVSNLTEVTPEVEEYLMYDNKALFEVLEKFYEQPIIKAAGYASTIASQSMKVFQNYLKRPLPPCPAAVDNFVRESYIGGRTEIFKPLFNQVEDNQVLSTYDANSLYPFVMQFNDFPAKFKKWTDKYCYGEMGFYDVLMEVPEMYVPPLGIKWTDRKFKKFIFPTGRIRAKWSSIEIEYAVSLGCKILKVYEGAVFHNEGPIFKDYITDLYQMRLNSPKNSVTNILCKLLMNSSYGRFGLNIERDKLSFEETEDSEPYHDIDLGNNMVKTIWKSKTFLDKTFTNPAIAAWVTSLSRIHMHKAYMEAPEDLYYTDTDSMFTTHKYESNPDKLGALKFEYNSKNAYFVLPKSYYTETTLPLWKVFGVDGKLVLDDLGMPIVSTVHRVMKGFDSRKLSHLSQAEFYETISGEVSMLKAVNSRRIGTFGQAAARNTFLTIIEEAEREIRSKYDKRRVYRRQWAQGFDTEALHVKDGVIVNQNMKADPKKDDKRKLLAQLGIYA